MRRYRPLAGRRALDRDLRAGRRGLRPERRSPTDERFPITDKTFTAALSAIESNYVDKVDSDRLVYSAIRGMLGTLDPHSSFFDPKEYAQMRERQEGRYYGLGITIQSVDGDITAASVFEGSPAYKAASAAATSSRTSASDDDEGLDDRSGARQAARSEGHERQIEIKRRGYAQPIPLDVDARRGVHPDRHGVLHDRRDDRLHPPQGLRREHRSRHPAGAARTCRRRA